MTEIVERFDGEDPEPLVNVTSLPPSVLEAIVKNLQQPVQKATQVFRKNYIVEIDNLKQLLIKIEQEFRGDPFITKNLTLSLHLSSNQRFDFASWKEFAEFDSSKNERTKSISFTYTRSASTPDNKLQIYKVQVAIQNLQMRHSIFLGPVILSRIEDAGLPPVPIHSSVEYSDYVMGKNLIGVVEQWADSLSTDERPIINWLQRNSGKIRSIFVFLVTLAALIGPIIYIKSVGPENYNIALLLFYASAFIYTIHEFSKQLARLLEYYIDSYKKKNTISITRGDTKYEEKIDISNKKLILKSITVFISLLIHIALGLVSNHIYYRLLDG
ncbi:hypothetical protein RYZ18_09480 [Roseovarius sp. 10]|uniref:hypothetical protein n=1 Tax=Roseovarius sp. 10 TaxID=3080563 RepID=UPI002954451B|nr:hypothetical protein [Roseovarius sp. 10]MDV7201556.1 hypothetical protein [Roseovarius sp. 10]